jgi:hypothetical protein
MPFQILLEEDGLALDALGVLGSLFAFVQKVVLKILDLNDLLTLPTRIEHGTLLPIVNV